MFRLFYWTLAIAMVLCFLSAVAITFTITMTRYFLAFSDPTAEYLSRYFVILGTFIGFPVAVLHGLHVRFDLVDYALHGRARRIFQIAGAVLSAMICAVFAYCGWLFVEDSRMFGEIMPTGFALPLWIPHTSVLLGMALGVVAYIIVLARGPVEIAEQEEAPPTS